jgi:protein gp37
MKESLIEWTDYTFNPWIGCTKVSPGCANCYAEHSTPVRTMKIEWGKGNPRHRTSESSWNKIRSLNRKSEKAGIRTKVFCASLADWLDPEVPSSWLCDLLELIRETPNLDWQLVTKRPELFHDRMAAVIREWESSHGASIARNWRHLSIPPSNVWFGITTENQKTFDDRTRELSFISANLKFLSVEPLLEPITLKVRDQIDWIIVGGESGKNARSTDLAWIESIANQSTELKIPLFVKQLGSRIFHHELQMQTRHPKGGNIDEFPTHLQRREFPSIVAF